MIGILIVFISILILLILITFNIKIHIENLKIILPFKDKRIINKESKILLKIYLLKKIKIAEIDLKNIKTDDKKFKDRMNKFKKNIKPDFYKNILNISKKINYKIEKINLKIVIGIEDAAITAIGVGIISTLISILLKDKIISNNSQKYQIIPNYKNYSSLSIEIDGIFTFNIANIKDIINFLKKGRVDKNDRSSYRRAYAYSNE